MDLMGLGFGIFLIVIIYYLEEIKKELGKQTSALNHIKETQPFFLENDLYCKENHNNRNIEWIGIPHHIPPGDYK